MLVIYGDVYWKMDVYWIIYSKQSFEASNLALIIKTGYLSGKMLTTT